LAECLTNAKNLLREIAKLKFWAIGAQYSIESLRDDEYVICCLPKQIAECRFLEWNLE